MANDAITMSQRSWRRPARSASNARTRHSIWTPIFLASASAMSTSKPVSVGPRKKLKGGNAPSVATMILPSCLISSNVRASEMAAVKHSVRARILLSNLIVEPLSSITIRGAQNLVYSSFSRQGVCSFSNSLRFQIHAPPHGVKTWMRLPRFRGHTQQVGYIGGSVHGTKEEAEFQRGVQGRGSPAGARGQQEPAPGGQGPGPDRIGPAQPGERGRRQRGQG